VYLDQNFFGDPSVRPSFDFLLRELQHGEDVELLFGFYKRAADGIQLERIGGHYVTLTGVKADDANDNKVPDAGEGGQLTFIDPLTGLPATESLFDQEGFLRTSYSEGQDQVLFTFVEAAVSESPIPAPAAWVLVATGLGALAARRRRRR
jgi:MYXO-CTERM domain-containing protein